MYEDEYLDMAYEDRYSIPEDEEYYRDDDYGYEDDSYDEWEDTESGDTDW